MTKPGILCSSVAAIAIAAVLAAASCLPASAQQTPAATIHIGTTDVGGTVTSANGPEAGVWVIAETTDLPTKFARIVVTDDQGRYLLPDLPKANYSVWVRGYGLVDSPKVQTEPGKRLDLKAVIAPSKAAAAQYYPAEYWFSMLKIPDKSEFVGAGIEQGKMPKNMPNQYAWLDNLKTNGCVGCHQLGEKSTRTLPAALGTFKTGAEAWQQRIESGQAAPTMVRDIGLFNAQIALANFGDWTDRIAKGEIPASAPPRPTGIERNVVVTLWDWGSATTYMHDEASTDKRHPTVNGYGKIYGSPELSTDEIPVLDPVKNSVSFIKLEVRDPKTPSTKEDAPMAPSPYWGDARIWDSQTSTHNPMFDEKGRVWFTSRIRPSKDPAFCQKGSDLESAKIDPISKSSRQLEMYDPKSGKITLVDTCFQTHHLQFGFDANDTLWTSGNRNAVGWLNTKMFEKTGDETKSQGWATFVIDTNGDGKRDIDDKAIKASFYAVAPSPVDGSVWGSDRGFPGAIIRVTLGDNPPATALSEFYEPPWNDPSVKVQAYGIRGMDIDSHGVVWMGMSSGHLGSFDRRKCKGPLNGPKALGTQCPEGWSFYQFPGPQFENVKDPGSVESSYYTWVDQHDTLGLGDNVPVATGDESDSLLAFVNGKFVTLRVPYPMGFYAKGLDGRIDDPKAGWKGRGLWSTVGSRTPFHMEGGKGTLPKVVHFQIRPDPLAD